jgi:SAM-dependent methyltransferase
MRSSPQRSKRSSVRRWALILFGALAALFLADTAWEARKTLRQLDVIETERDKWQRAEEILGALDLKSGDTVVDLGCGAGYFTLKLFRLVGPSGKVQAVDIRRLSLFFLWMRTFQKHISNVDTKLGSIQDPGLTSNSADAVLIVNTYHELSRPGAILDRVSAALRRGGRLVITDPEQTESGGNSLDGVEEELRRRGFDIVTGNDRFLEQSGRGSWWLIVARKR